MQIYCASEKNPSELVPVMGVDESLEFQCIGLYVGLHNGGRTRSFRILI